MTSNEPNPTQTAEEQDEISTINAMSFKLNVRISSFSFSFFPFFLEIKLSSSIYDQ